MDLRMQDQHPHAAMLPCCHLAILSIVSRGLGLVNHELMMKIFNMQARYLWRECSMIYYA